MEKDQLKLLVHDDIRVIRSVHFITGTGLSLTRMFVKRSGKNIISFLTPADNKDTDTNTVTELYYALVKSAANLHADNDDVSAWIIIENLETAVQRYLK